MLFLVSTPAQPSCCKQHFDDSVGEILQDLHVVMATLTKKSWVFTFQLQVGCTALDASLERSDQFTEKTPLLFIKLQVQGKKNQNIIEILLVRV